MTTQIKISSADNLKILKEIRKPLIAKQIHKNKKAYTRQVKHKKLDY